MIINSEYEDPTKFKLVFENRYCDNINSYIEQELYDINNKVNVKRKLIFKKVVCNKKELENIKNRSIIQPFVADNNTSEVKSLTQDDIWMEYNPEILKGKASQKYLAKLLLSDSDEKIKVFDNSEAILKETLLNINKNLNLPNINQRIANIMDIKNKKQIINTNKKYTPQFNKFQNKTTESKKYDIHKNSVGIKISNIPEDIDDQFLKNWLSSFNLNAYRLQLPKDKRTRKSRQFAFLTFNNKNNATNAINLLNGAKFEYNIISAELSKY